MVSGNEKGLMTTMRRKGGIHRGDGCPFLVLVIDCNKQAKSVKWPVGKVVIKLCARPWPTKRPFGVWCTSSLRRRVVILIGEI